MLAKGYGVRKLGEPAPVDARRLFGIASNTKVFTATALGLLVEEKKIEWDAPVVRYLPAFAMWEPFVTHELTVRDLLVHRSGLGLGAGDLLWWPESTYDRKEIARLDAWGVQSANTAIFSLLDAVMLRLLPVREPARLVQFARQRPPFRPQRPGPPFLLCRGVARIGRRELPNSFSDSVRSIRFACEPRNPGD